MKEAFKKEEFRDLFNDYIEEISDPKNRAVRFARAARASSRPPRARLAAGRRVLTLAAAGLVHRSTMRTWTSARERGSCRTV